MKKCGNNTYYPSSSKNLTTTRGIRRKPSLISSGRDDNPFTSPEIQEKISAWRSKYGSYILRYHHRDK